MAEDNYGDVMYGDEDIDYGDEQISDEEKEEQLQQIMEYKESNEASASVDYEGGLTQEDKDKISNTTDKINQLAKETDTTIDDTEPTTINVTDEEESNTDGISSIFYQFESDFEKQEAFEITSVDIEELDIFFKINNRMYKESIAHINIHSAANLEPIFALGSPIMLDAVSGVKIFAGKIIINALNNQMPLSKLCSAFNVADVYELPQIDLYIVPKNSKEKYSTAYSGIVIKRIKFKEWFADKSTENPGSFFVMTFVSPFAGLLNTSYNSSKLKVKMSNPLEYDFNINEYNLYVSDIITFQSCFTSKEWKVFAQNIISQKNPSEAFKKNVLIQLPVIYDYILTYLMFKKE